jgi:hypothetical protein
VDPGFGLAVVVDGDYGPAVGANCDDCGVDLPDASALTNRATIAITVMMTTQRTVLGFTHTSVPSID